MVLSATNAQALTTTSITVQNASDVQREVGFAEAGIRNAANRQLYQLVYNAEIIGNPIADPLDTDRLTARQILFRDGFTTAGYTVARDDETGYWLIAWEDIGPENLVSVYSVRTTVLPGAISTATITAIETYLQGLDPVVRVKAEVVSINGGDILEADINGTNSVFYQYTVVTTQTVPATDYSSGILQAMIDAGLGYSDSPANTAVYKVI